jgi:hypothetical protein
MVNDEKNLSLVWRMINLIPIYLIKFYKVAISPAFPPSCRFQPTCSAYALEAFQKHNFFYAAFLTVWRILRCNPFVKGGYDPVPNALHNHQEHHQY